MIVIVFPLVLGVGPVVFAVKLARAMPVVVDTVGRTLLSKIGLVLVVSLVACIPLVIPTGHGTKDEVQEAAQAAGLADVEGGILDGCRGEMLLLGARRIGDVDCGILQFFPPVLALFRKQHLEMVTVLGVFGGKDGVSVELVHGSKGDSGGVIFLPKLVTELAAIFAAELGCLYPEPLLFLGDNLRLKDRPFVTGRVSTSCGLVVDLSRVCLGCHSVGRFGQVGIVSEGGRSDDAGPPHQA